MAVKFKVFVLRLKQDFPNIISTHCFVNRGASVIISNPNELKNVLDSVNYIKSRALSS